MALEQYLDCGYVRFGTIGERFFRASYTDLFHNVVVVESQLGSMHLMHQLEVEILKEIKKDIEAVRAFEKEAGSLPVSFPFGDKYTSLDHLLINNALVVGFNDAGGVKVCVYQTGHRETPREKVKKASPGIYTRRGFASSFLEAVRRAKDDTEPTSFDLSTELPERFCVNRL